MSLGMPTGTSRARRVLQGNSQVPGGLCPRPNAVSDDASETLAACAGAVWTDCPVASAQITITLGRLFCILLGRPALMLGLNCLPCMTAAQVGPLVGVGTAMQCGGCPMACARAWRGCPAASGEVGFAPRSCDAYIRNDGALPCTQCLSRVSDQSPAFAGMMPGSSLLAQHATSWPRLRSKLPESQRKQIDALARRANRLPGAAGDVRAQPAVRRRAQGAGPGGRVVQGQRRQQSPGGRADAAVPHREAARRV